MRQRWNGSIQSANAPTYDKTGIAREDFGMYRCMVIDVLYVDDDRNISKNSKNPEVLYEVIILGGIPSGQTLSFCRLAPYLCGDNNYSEFTLRKTSKDVSKVKLADHDGDVVYVQFVQGHDAYPVIIGMAKGLNNKIGATKSDGPRFIEGYNGLEKLVNNKGEYITTMKGGSTSNGFFSAGSSAVIKEEWLSTEKIIRTFKSGMTITEDGQGDKVSIKTAAGAEIIIDGASGKITLKSSMIDLGNSVSDFVTMFTQLATAFATHMHPYTDDGSPAVTGPPMAPLLTSVGSQTVKVQP